MIPSAIPDFWRGAHLDVCPGGQSLLSPALGSPASSGPGGHSLSASVSSPLGPQTLLKSGWDFQWPHGGLSSHLHCSSPSTMPLCKGFSQTLAASVSHGNKCEKSPTSAWLSALLSDKAGPQAGMAAAWGRTLCSRALEMVCGWMAAGDEACVCV